MKTITLKDKKTGKIVDNNELVYFNVDSEKQFPIKRIIRWALIRTNKTMSIDQNGMEGEGDWGLDTFWNYFKEFYPELLPDIPSSREFDEILIDRFCL